MLEYFWWGSVFLLSVPVMVLLLILGPISPSRVPRSRRRQTRSRECGAFTRGSARDDLWAEAGRSGWREHHRDAFVVAGVVTGAVFVRRQLHLAHPLIDLRLFGIPAFRASRS
jgi:DHA2 family multidrug resistance protein-like MFS transporter